MTDGFFDVAGRRLEYRRVAGRDPALVLLHEGLGCVAMWRDFPERLAKATGNAVMAYSRAGYGKSSPVPLPRPARYMHDEAELLPGVLDAAGIGDCVLVGHSDGGSIALIYAGGGGPMKARGVVTLAAHVFNEKLCVDSIAAAKAAWRDTDLRARLKRYHGDNVDVAFKGWNDVWLSDEFWRWNIEEYLPRVTVPVLAIQGRDDEYGTERQVDAIIGQVKGHARKLMLEKCKHSAHRDQPEKTVEAIKGFVAGLSA